MPRNTRMKIAALQREMLTKAQTYKRQWDNYNKAKAEGKQATPPDRDINLDPLVEVLERSAPSTSIAIAPTTS